MLRILWKGFFSSVEQLSFGFFFFKICSLIKGHFMCSIHVIRNINIGETIIFIYYLKFHYSNFSSSNWVSVCIVFYLLWKVILCLPLTVVCSHNITLIEQKENRNFHYFQSNRIFVWLMQNVNINTNFIENNNIRIERVIHTGSGKISLIF